MLKNGYFDNVGKTSRKGIDMNIGGKTLHLDGTEAFHGQQYSYMRAEYESDFTLVSDGNDSRTTVTNSYSGLQMKTLGMMEP